MSSRIEYHRRTADQSLGAAQQQNHHQDDHQEGLCRFSDDYINNFCVQWMFTITSLSKYIATEGVAHDRNVDFPHPGSPRRSTVTVVPLRWSSAAAITKYVVYE